MTELKQNEIERLFNSSLFDFHSGPNNKWEKNCRDSLTLLKTLSGALAVGLYIFDAEEHCMYEVFSIIPEKTVHMLEIIHNEKTDRPVFGPFFELDEEQFSLLDGKIIFQVLQKQKKQIYFTAFEFGDKAKTPITIPEKLKSILLMIAIQRQNKNLQELPQQQNSEPTLKLFKTTIDAINDYLVVLDQQLQIVLYNKAFQLLCSLFETNAPNSLYGIKITDLFPATKEEIDDHLLFTFRSGQQTRFEQIVDLQQARINFEATVMPIHESQQVEYVVIAIHNITELKEKEMVITKQREFYSQLINHLPVGVFGKDPNNDMNFTVWNRKMAELMNRSTEEMLGKNDFDLHPLDRAKLFLKEDQSVLANRKQLNINKTHIKTDRTDFFGNIIKLPIYDTQGNPDTLLGIVEDVSENIMIEQEIKKYQETLEQQVEEQTRELTKANAEMTALINNSNSFIIASFTADKKLALYNDSFRQFSYDIWGSKPKKGTHLSNIIPEEKSFAIYNEILDVCLGGKTINSEDTMATKNGKEQVYQQVFAPKRADTNEIIGIVFFAIDITERISAQRELSLFKTIAENAHYGAVIVDMEYEIVYANSYIAAIHGLHKDDLPGKHLSIFHDKEQFLSLKVALESAKETGSLNSFEVWHTYSGTIKFPMLTTATFIKNRKGNIKFIGITALDMSLQKEAERDLEKARDRAEQAMKSKSEFLANTSHEIRTPLNAILGFTELLAKIFTKGKEHNYLSAIQASGKNLLTIINDILDLSKIEAGKLSLQYSPVDIRSFLGEIIAIFTHKAEEKGLKVNLLISESLPEVVKLDEVRVRQILFNLLGNAIKFTNEGHVDVTAQLHGFIGDSITLQLVVSDTGIGIEESSQDKIFESFEQSSGQDSRLYGGTGLGLAISKRLVEMMHGNIVLKSKIGQGSSFTVILPDLQICEVETKKLTQQDTTSLVPNFQDIAILTVDDKKLNRDLIGEYLLPTKATMLFAKNGKEALDIYQECRPDVILMDIRMPVMSGLETLTHIRESFSDSATPVIALTASVLEEKVQEFIEKGFTDFLPKPVNQNKLLNTINKYIDCEVNIVEEASRPEETLEAVEMGKIQIPRECTSQFIENVVPYFEEAEDTFMNTDIQRFAEKIADFSEEFHIDALKLYSNELLEHLSSFDITGLKKCLEDFHTIQDNLY